MCAACVQTVSKALLALNGVLEVTVSLGQKTAKARFDSTCVRPETIREEIDAVGFDASIIEVKNGIENDTNPTSDSRAQQLLG